MIAMSLTELATSMFKFPPGSDAWKDFAADCLERLAVASLTAAARVDAPADFSDYWLSVAAGESEAMTPMAPGGDGPLACVAARPIAQLRTVQLHAYFVSVIAEERDAGRLQSRNEFGGR
jgi:hypothetical protein